MNTLAESATALARRAHVEALLAAYPDVTTDERETLLRWFRREASAMDVGMLASDPSLARGYARFRAEHIDRFTWKDVLKGITGGVVIVGIAALIMLRAW
ncbi:MAG: hypothetical protein RIS94_491 [Pseudomonadota bacterium]|jgi:hypothetical protein